MKTKDITRRITEIAAEIAAIPEFAVGSIISSSSYYTTKDGARKQTKPQYKFQTRGGRGKQKLRHIPAAFVPKVRKLIENGRKVEMLEAEYKRLVTETSLDALKKTAEGSDPPTSAPRQRPRPHRLA